MKALIVLFAVWICCTALLAQRQKPQAGALFETKPAAVPTVLTAIASVDAHIRQITVFVPASTVATVTLQDNQGSPIPFGGVVTTSAPSGTTYFWSWQPGSEYYAPNGFSIQSSAPGPTFQATWLQDK